MISNKFLYGTHVIDTRDNMTGIIVPSNWVWGENCSTAEEFDYSLQTSDLTVYYYNERDKTVYAILEKYVAADPIFSSRLKYSTYFFTNINDEFRNHSNYDLFPDMRYMAYSYGRLNKEFIKNKQSKCPHFNRKPILLLNSVVYNCADCGEALE
jgi:hypothetical protein